MFICENYPSGDAGIGLQNKGRDTDQTLLLCSANNNQLSFNSITSVYLLVWINYNQFCPNFVSGLPPLRKERSEQNASERRPLWQWLACSSCTENTGKFGNCRELFTSFGDVQHIAHSLHPSNLNLFYVCQQVFHWGRSSIAMACGSEDFSLLWQYPAFCSPRSASWVHSDTRWALSSNGDLLFFISFFSCCSPLLNQFQFKYELLLFLIHSCTLCFMVSSDGICCETISSLAHFFSNLRDVGKCHGLNITLFFVYWFCSSLYIIDVVIIFQKYVLHLSPFYCGFCVQ